MMQRYVCPDCLRTFLSKERHHNWICWKCGERLIVVGAEDKDDARLVPREGEQDD